MTLKCSARLTKIFFPGTTWQLHDAARDGDLVRVRFRFVCRLVLSLESVGLVHDTAHGGDMMVRVCPTHLLGPPCLPLTA
jgi:hypothetical protein